MEYDYHFYLFPAIALQLALVVADADSLFSCSGCGHPYLRSKKKPRSGAANYCDLCVKKGVDRLRATKSYRAKLAYAALLHREGKSVAEIAEQLGTDVNHVRKWVLRGEHEKTKTRK